MCPAGVIPISLLLKGWHNADCSQEWDCWPRGCTVSLGGVTTSAFDSPGKVQLF